MSAITIDGDLIHYEKLGRGRPVILVHGWIGSWRYWIPLMQQLHLRYKVYTLDLLGYGDSAKNPERYSIDRQVAMLSRFMEQLGIMRAAMIGHGLGSLVLTRFALENPDKIARMLIISAPLLDPGDLDTRSPANYHTPLPPPPLNNDATVPSGGQVDNAGNANEETIMRRPAAFNEMPTVGNPGDLRERLQQEMARKQNSNALNKLFKNETIMSLLDKSFKRSEDSYEKLRVDVEKADDGVLKASITDFDAGTMLDNLRRVNVPVLAVHGENDPVIPPPDEAIWNYLTIGKDNLFVPIPLPDVRHFPMLEHEAFSRLTTDFLDTEDINKLEIRERWRRRTR